jgi:hypothetical protein
MSENGGFSVGSTIDAITGNLATDVTKAIGRMVSNTKPIRRVSDAFGFNKLNPKVEDILKKSVVMANDNANLSGRVLKDFTSRSHNYRIIAKWIIFPSYKYNQKELDFSSFNYEEVPKLRRFSDGLYENIIKNREIIFSPETWTIIKSINLVEEKIINISEQLEDFGKKFSDLERTNRQDLVSYKQWLEQRYKSNFDKRRKLTLVETANISRSIDKYIDKLKSDSNKVCIIVGQIGTGKSMLVEAICNRYKELNNDNKVKIYVLPLTQGFKLEKDWSLKESRNAFIDLLSISKEQDDYNGLFIIEDAHEGEGSLGIRWTGNSQIVSVHGIKPYTSNPR